MSRITKVTNLTELTGTGVVPEPVGVGVKAGFPQIEKSSILNPL